MFKIGIFVSGFGSNMEAIINAVENKELAAEVSIVVADRDCAAISKAIKDGIPTLIIPRKQLKNKWHVLQALLAPLKLDVIVLAGFLSIVKDEFFSEYQDKVINIHPSLLPKYSGMHGLNVHKEVIKNADSITGVTVHYVNEIVDGGKIILQKKVPVISQDTAETLAERVLKVEHKVLIESLQIFFQNLN